MKSKERSCHLSVLLGLGAVLSLAPSEQAMAGISCWQTSPAIQLYSFVDGQRINQGILPGSFSCERTFGGSAGDGERRSNQGDRGGGRGTLSPAQGDPDDQNQNAGESCPASGNPVVLATGNKIEPETDFGANGPMALHLKRTWNQHSEAITLFGFHWISNFDYKLSFGTTSVFGALGTCYARPSVPECTTASSNVQAWAHRPDGRMIRFTKAADGVYYENKPSPISRLVRQSNGTWLLTFEDGLSELYSAGGNPLWIQDEHGVRWTYTYGGLSGTQVQRVTHTSGRYVEFIWVGDELREVRDPAGNPYRFTYTAQSPDDGLHVLKTTTLPGATPTVITYHYTSEPGEPYQTPFYALTGKSFNGARYSKFSYDTQGLALSTEHVGGVEKYTFSYSQGQNGALSVLETNPLGKQTSYSFQDGRLVGISGYASSHCPSASASSTYDFNGFLNVQTDFNGNATDFDYNAKGQLQKKVEAVGRLEERVTTYVWDPVKNRITSETLVGQGRLDYTFDSNDRLATVIATNISPSHPANQNETRTTSYSYTVHSNGLIATMSVNGPLPNDDVMYTYSQQGDLLQISNGLGHSTTYSNYNSLGQPGRRVGPNGDTTEYDYDARGRIVVMRTYPNGPANETRYTYDANGLLSAVVTPDGVEERYTYDSARRLIKKAYREAGGTYAVTEYVLNAMSLPTSTTVSRVPGP